MWGLAAKALLSGALIVAIAEIGKRLPAAAALVASLPLVSVLGMMLLWRERPDAENMAVHAEATFWYVLPSLPMFLLIPALLRGGVAFWLALAAGCLVTVGLYLLMVRFGPGLGCGCDAVLIIGLDPGLGVTGWGVVASTGSRLAHVANGQVRTDPAAPLAGRLATLDRELADVVARFAPDAGAVEEVFVNANPQSTLKLGQARGVCLLVLARAGLPVSEYATRAVKKALVGTGGAEKAQIQAMLRVLLPGVTLAGPDAADALAVAIAHAHMFRG